MNAAQYLLDNPMVAEAIEAEIRCWLLASAESQVEGKRMVEEKQIKGKTAKAVEESEALTPALNLLRWIE